MDRRSIFLAVRDIAGIAEGADEAYRAMAPRDAELTASADPDILEAFKRRVSASVTTFEYEKTLQFVKEMASVGKPGFQALNDYIESMGESGYNTLLSHRLAKESYTLIYWLMRQLSKLYPSSYTLARTVRDFNPVAEEGEKRQLSRRFQEYQRMVERIPDIPNCGYTDVSTMLMLSGDDAAQTVLIRMGASLWEAVSPRLSLYYPILEGQTESDIPFEIGVEDRYDSVRDLVPLAIFLGLRIHFSFGGREASVTFRFHTYNPTDIEFSLGDEVVLRLDYLDDCLEPQEALGGLSVYSAIVASEKICFHLV